MVSELSGQVALVTGGVRGMGRAISEALIAEGVRVAAGYSRSWTAADAFYIEHGSHGATVHQGTIGEIADCERVVEEVIDRHGRIDILVNGAGITMDGTARDMTPEQWDRAVEINVAGAFAMARAAMPHMVRQRYGRVIGISPLGVDVETEEGEAACAVQFDLTTNLAMEVANKGVTVNCVAPGFVEPDWPAAPTARAQNGASAGTPMRRIGTPTEVARLVVFLAQPSSDHITGQVYSIDGGLNLCVRPSRRTHSNKRSIT